MEKKPSVVFMPHANLQYSQLRPEAREWVVRNCYEKLFDLIRRNRWHMAFEASGRTVDLIQELAPDVMKKLRDLVQDGLVEPVASPYVHFMLSNVPRELCLRSLRRSLDAWERCVGARPRVGWNPECGWTSYITEVYRQAGLEALVMDADSFFLSFDEIRDATGLRYDVEGHSNKTQLFRIEEYIREKPWYLKFVTNPTQAPNGLKLIFRSDCMANLLLWYLMGATEGIRGKPVERDEIREMFCVWKERVTRTGTFLMPYAEDAEYIGSSAYFYVKQFNEARFFEPAPDSVRRFQEIVEMACDAGYELTLPSRVLEEAGKPELNPYVDCIENGVAWHGGTAKAWANTDQARVMDPVCRSVYEGVCTVRDNIGTSAQARQLLEQALDALESAWVSDSRWPPRPTSPGRFNVRESIDDLYSANEALGKAMEAAGLARRRSLYSPQLMLSQIRAMEKELMAMDYFEEGRST